MSNWHGKYSWPTYWPIYWPIYWLVQSYWLYTCICNISLAPFNISENQENPHRNLRRWLKIFCLKKFRVQRVFIYRAEQENIDINQMVPFRKLCRDYPENTKDTVRPILEFCKFMQLRSWIHWSCRYNAGTMQVQHAGINIILKSEPLHQDTNFYPLVTHYVFWDHLVYTGGFPWPRLETHYAKHTSH